MLVVCAVCAGTRRAENLGVLAFPPRPGFGTLDRPIQLTTNVFRVDMPESMAIYHYDVEIAPHNIPCQLRQRVMQAAIMQNTHFLWQFLVFDGEKNMYCLIKKLPEAKVHWLII